MKIDVMIQFSHFRPRARRLVLSTLVLLTLLMLCLSDSSASATLFSPDTRFRAPTSNSDLDARHPLVPFTLINAFEPPSEPWLPGHRGIDLGAHVGQDVYALSSGTIHFSGVVAGRSVVSLRLPNGDLISLEPVTTPHSRGDVIQAGAVIGTVTDETGHCSNQTCVHLGLRRNNEYLNPLLLFADLRPPIVLLPPIA